MLPEGTIITKGQRLIRTFGSSFTSYKFAEVDHITKTMIILTNGQRFCKDGSGVVGDKYSMYGLWLETPELMQKIQREEAISLLRATNMYSLPDDTVIAIANLVREYQEKRGIK